MIRQIDRKQMVASYASFNKFYDKISLRQIECGVENGPVTKNADLPLAT